MLHPFWTHSQHTSNSSRVNEKEMSLPKDESKDECYEFLRNYDAVINVQGDSLRCFECGKTDALSYDPLTYRTFCSHHQCITESKETVKEEGVRVGKGKKYPRKGAIFVGAIVIVLSILMVIVFVHVSPKLLIALLSIAYGTNYCGEPQFGGLCESCQSTRIGDIVYCYGLSANFIACVVGIGMAILWCLFARANSTLCATWWSRAKAAILKAIEEDCDAHNDTLLEEEEEEEQPIPTFSNADDEIKII